ncbi:alpha/beta hydrolase [Micromonospora sp. NPDC000089]|uniref:alpha/beta hydrolase n=1 Tax=unclassified Micromonospora TaxID=2617518 RepID=UPI0036A62D85
MTSPMAKPFVLSPPAAPVERHGSVDLHLPAGDGPFPAVVVLHGAPLPPGTPDCRDMPVFRGYGALLAEQGVVAGVVNYRVEDIAQLPATADGIAAMVEQVRADPRVDGDRVALWFFSGGGLFTGDWLRDPPPWLRAIALTYPLLVPFPEWGVEDKRFLPVEALGGTGRVPVVLTRAGQDMPLVLASIEAFLTAAERVDWPVQVLEVPDGGHSFDLLLPTEESRQAIRTARDAVVALLRAD